MTEPFSVYQVHISMPREKQRKGLLVPLLVSEHCLSSVMYYIGSKHCRKMTNIQCSAESDTMFVALALYSSTLNLKFNSEYEANFNLRVFLTHIR
uniref:Uncharacterized protein n=1 Tax=Anguilla anguilla TaxID=7936 RepID=A0A0E9WXX3_ANGAN